MDNWEPVSYDGNLQKFLDFLGKAEGADYNTIVGGKTFDDFSAHPNVVGLQTKEGPSKAAGKYQITKTTYDDVAPKLGIKDFSPASQDRIAIELIKRKGALEDIQSGNFDAAINKLGGTWASLPSSQYNQPKRSKEWVDQQLAYTNTGGWEPAATVSDAGNGDWTPAAEGWEPVAKQEAPKSQQELDAIYKQQKAAQPSQAKPAEAPMDYKSLGKKALRVVDDAVRGAADTLTFGFADEIAAKMDQLTGRTKSYEQGLKEQRARDAEGGTARLVGQVGGALLPTGAVVRGMDSGSRLVRMGAGAATGALQGGLYGAGTAEEGKRLEGAQEGAAFGALTGGVLGGVLPATVQQKGSSFIKKAGSEEGARLDSEIVRDLSKIAENPNARGVKTQAVQMNALEQKYVADANNAIKSLGKDGLSKLGTNQADIQAAIQARRILTPEELNSLRGNTAGNALADAIEKAQRTRALTAPNPADNNILVKGIRVGADYVLPGIISKPINYMLNNRKSREEVVAGLLKNQDAAANALERLGPSQASQSLEALQQLAQKAQAGRQAQIAQQQAQKAAALAQQATNKNQILQQTRMPAGGGFQELLNGGASGLNMTSKEAIDALRTVSKVAKGTPVGDAAATMLKSQPVKDEQAFYGVQNMIRRLSEEGKVGSGATSVGQGALSSGIRNPASYEANVKNATEALKVAREAAPTPELAQFAATVGRTKNSAEKLKKIEQRLANAKDPAEVEYLNTLVKPLANFGKK